MCDDLASSSSANTLPTFSTNSGFHVAPRAMPTGVATDGEDMLPQAPRAPLGPSVILNCGIPKRETATLCQRSAPASIDIFSSMVICARRSLMRDISFSLFDISKADQFNLMRQDILLDGGVGKYFELHF